MSDKQTVHRNISLYHDLFDFVKKIADRDHRGNFSRAIQCMVEAEMRREDQLTQLTKADDFYQSALDKLNNGDCATIEEALVIVKREAHGDMLAADPRQSFPKSIKKRKEESA